MNYWKILIMGAGLLLFAGCGTGKPEGIPALHPVSIKITKGDVPVDDAQVLLAATTPPPAVGQSLARPTLPGLQRLQLPRAVGRKKVRRKGNTKFS